MKQILPLFTTIGRRKKLLGFEASYDGEVIGTFDSKVEAERTLDALAFETLRRAS